MVSLFVGKVIPNSRAFAGIEHPPPVLVSNQLDGNIFCSFGHILAELDALLWPIKQLPIGHRTVRHLPMSESCQLSESCLISESCLSSSVAFLYPFVKFLETSLEYSYGKTVVPYYFLPRRWIWFAAIIILRRSQNVFLVFLRIICMSDSISSSAGGNPMAFFSRRT